MKITITLTGADIVQLATEHLRQKFKDLAQEDEWLSVTRVGTVPPDMQLTVEAVRKMPNPRD